MLKFSPTKERVLGMFLTTVPPVLFFCFSLLSLFTQLHSLSAPSFISHTGAVSLIYFLSILFVHLFSSDTPHISTSLSCPSSVLYLLTFFHSSIHTPRFFSLSQFYDLGSPAESSGSSPGCVMTDSSCVNMGYPSCGPHGRCHGEWGSFSCQCLSGYTGHQCEQGTPNLHPQNLPQPPSPTHTPLPGILT